MSPWEQPSAQQRPFRNTQVFFVLARNDPTVSCDELNGLLRDCYHRERFAAGYGNQWWDYNGEKTVVLHHFDPSETSLLELVSILYSRDYSVYTGAETPVFAAWNKVVIITQVPYEDWPFGHLLYFPETCFYDFDRASDRIRFSVEQRRDRNPIFEWA